MELTLQSRVRLNNGVQIPRLGLGVYQLSPGDETRRAVRWALEAGYRHIDTARLYGNEAEVGDAIRASGVPREEIFVTTKVWNADQGYARTLQAFEESRRLLGLEAIDLYLIHWPVHGLRNETWRALEQLQRDGRCRAIGVSNYLIRHLQELFDASSIKPSVNQIEVSPFLYPQELIHFCAQHEIQIAAYSPLTKGTRLRHPEIVAIARRQARTTAQVLIRWALQHNLVVIPRSSRKERILENAQVFDFVLDRQEMGRLDALHENLHTGWDPADAP